MQFNKAGMELLKHFEGLRLHVYLCPGGHKTVGYGHRIDDMNVGDTITKEQADIFLGQDLERFIKGVKNLLEVDINDNRFSALVCLAYNIGLGRLAGSGILKEINNERFATAATRFVLYSKSNGKELPGLLVRREAEKHLFLTPVDAS